MKFFPSLRAKNVAPFIVMDVLREAQAREKSGKPVYHLEVGQPGQGAPSAALQRLQACMTHEALGYTDSFGRADLRQALAQHYADTYAVDVDPARIAVTAGSSAGFQLAFLAAFQPGDTVALASPGYPAYRNILSALGLRVLELPVGAAERYQPHTAMLRAHHDIKGLILASPSNPTGTMLPPHELEALATYCHQQGIRLISDEIYHGLSYGTAQASAAQYSPSAIVVNSFSKYYGMTGWRVGWLILPEDLVAVVNRLSSNMFICAPHASQVAALGALEASEELEARKAGYQRNKRRLLDVLQSAGVEDIAPPDGAFYIYANIAKFLATGEDSMSFCKVLLEKTGVAITPGFDFDPQRGGSYVRLSFCAGEDDVQQAAEILAQYFAG